MKKKLLIVLLLPLAVMAQTKLVEKVEKKGD
jgi:hypothetical protein